MSRQEPAPPHRRLPRHHRADGAHPPPRPRGPPPPQGLRLRAEGRLRQAFVGSSNLSQAALLTAVEWNYRAVASSDTAAFQEIRTAFDALFDHPATQDLTRDWIDAYKARRKQPERPSWPEPPDLMPEPVEIPTPHSVQQAALQALEQTREDGNTAGLVVLATGLGKTWLSAFDSNRREYRRVLFVAHREEILNQSRDTFRRIRPEARLGFYTGQERQPEADVLFASIQTLGRAAHLGRFARDAFDGDSRA